MVSLEQAQSTLSQLVAKADQGDVSGGNDLLAEMKVRPHDTVVISMQYAVCSMQYAVCSSKVQSSSLFVKFAHPCRYFAILIQNVSRCASSGV